MDNLNTEDVSIDDVNQKEAKKRNSYVSRDHRSMVEFISNVYKNLGHSNYHTNKEIATVNGLSPDSIKQHLTSGQQYGLLEIKHRIGYKITDLFKRIYLPINELERKAAIVESLKTPSTYQQLFKEYEYHVVPPISGIKNHFVRHIHLAENIAEKAAQVFIDNLRDYELLDSRGVLISGMVSKQNSNETNNVKGDNGVSNDYTPPPPTTPPAYTPPPPPDDGLFELPIPLPNKRKAYLKYPIDSLTKKDIKVITKALEFVASSLEDDEDIQV